MAQVINGSSRTFETKSSGESFYSSSVTTSSRQINVQRVTELREITSKISASCKRDLDASTAATFQSATEAGVVLDYIASERLRCMPHAGSRYDKVLRWAEVFVINVSVFTESVNDFIMYNNDAAQLIWGSVLLLLQLGESHHELLDKLFGVYYKLGLGLDVFTEHGELLLQSAEGQKSCGKAYAALLELTTKSSFYYVKKASNGAVQVKNGEFERQFSRYVQSFHSSRSIASTEMWSTAVTSEISDIQYDVNTVRRFLAPQDTVTQALMSGQISSRHNRAEFTCEWASKQLSDYARSSDHMLMITGKEYSGKSVLAGWISERMRNTKGRLSHYVISYDIDPALKDNTSPLSVVQGLVLQTFDKLVGDLSLYRDVCAALHAISDGKNAQQIADLLWIALDHALAKMGKVMVIVDGIDQFEDNVKFEFLERLQQVSSKHSGAKAIAVSRPLTKAAPKNTRLWTIEVENTKHDIAHFTRERVASVSALKSLTTSQIQTLVDRITSAANGSFAWADLAVQIVLDENTVSGITKTVDSLPKSLKDLIRRLLATVDLKNRDTRSILAWMLAAQRPLLLDEVKSLLEVDYASSSLSERFTDVQDDVNRACRGLVTVTDGVLRFRTLAIRHQLIEMASNVKDFSNSSSNEFPFHIQEASYDLCLRTLAYVKFAVDRQYPVSTVPLIPSQLIEVFHEYALLEYASRYWLTHFRNSPMHQYPGAHKLTGTFKTCFPETVASSLIEGTCITEQYTLREASDLLQLSLTLRRTVLGEKHEAYLQTLVNVATVQRKVTTQQTNVFFYQAFKLCQTLLGYDSEVTITCAQRYIDSVHTVTTKSTEVEEALTYIIDIQKRVYGVSHDVTITYMQRLAQYYVTVKEESKAASLYRELYEVVTSRYGYSSTKTEEIFKSLKAVSKTEDIQKITNEQQVVSERKATVTDVTNTNSTKNTREVIAKYESENNVEKAEELMVNYWRELSEQARTSKDVKVQEQQVDATFEYVKFLQRQKRTEEATTILNGLYIELEKSTSFNQSKISWIHRIADQMKTMGSTTTATNVFSYLWSYYRSTGKQSSKEAQTVARSLTESASSTLQSSSTSVESQEQVLKEILETTNMSSESVDITTVKTTQSLVSLYTRQEKHEEIIQVCRDLLQRSWSSVLTGQKDVTMSKQFMSENIQIATQLAESYMKLQYVEEASQIYYSIFQAYRSQSKQYITELTSMAHRLITHYQSVYRHNEAIQIYEALYQSLVEVYGATSEQCINVLYEKAALEMKQNRRKAAQTSYEKIYTSLRGNSEYCHKDALKAATSLSKIYEKEQNWTAARSIYQVLWHTFLKKGQEYNFSAEFVDQIFDRYLYIIENKTQADYSTLRNLASEYREASIRLYGKDSERTISASMKLASLDEKDEKHKDEAISLYEYVLSTHASRKVAGATSFTVIATARKQLAHLYSERNVTSEKAKTLYEEEFASVRSNQGISSSEALFWFNLLVGCLKKQNTAESNKVASQMLQEVSTEIMLQETDTSKMYQASRTIAKIYQDYSVSGPTLQEFVTELRRQVITGEGSISFLKGKTTTRRSYNFIVGLEEVVSGGQFTVIMSELMTESLLTEAFIKAKKSQVAFDTVFSYGIRLRAFLKSKNRSEYTRVEEELLEIFKTQIVRKSDLDQAAVRQFFTLVLAEHDKDTQDIKVLKVAFEAISRAFNESQFARGFALATIADAYMHHYDGFRSQTKIEIAFKVCLLLSGRGTKKCNDAKLEQHMLHLSSILLQEVLQAAKAIQLNLVALPLDELNSLVGLLGQQKNYADLEWILHDLWTARHTQPSWPASTVVAIGRRLVECRFVMGDRISALDLLEDICYNLRRVWGPLDKTTLEMENLRAQLYTAAGQHAKVIGVHEDILAHLTSDELDLDQVTASEEASIAARHVASLRTAFLRNGAKWPADKDVHHYDDLFHIVQEQVGSEKAWTESKIEDVHKWAGAAKSFKDDGSGAWHGVSEGHWEFIADSGSKYKHINTMKHRARLSGNWSLANGGGQTNGGGTSSSYYSSNSSTSNGKSNSSSTTSYKYTNGSSSSVSSSKVDGTVQVSVPANGN